MWVLPALLACGTPAQSTEPAPAPAPEPTEVPAEATTVQIQIGRQCEEPADGEPADAAAVQAALDEAGLDVQGLESMAVCEACTTCPRLAFSVTTSQPDEVKALFTAPAGPPPAKVKVAAGRKCQDPAEGAPTSAEEMLAALTEAGVTVLAHEEMMVCQGCGCPEVALMIDVASADQIKVAEASKGWTPPPKENKLKGSLP